MTLGMISMISPREINEEVYVKADLSIKFSESNHFFYIMSLAVPSLFFWIFMVTFGIVYVLFRQNKLMKEMSDKS